MKTIHLPYLHDHHSHPLFYSAFGTGVSLEQVESKQEDNDLLVSAAQGRERITVAHGWRSNRFGWTADELEALPPVGIFNVSLHELLMNNAGRRLLHDQYGDATRQLENHDWYESNLRVVLNWFANLNASVEALKSFFDDLLQLGVYSAEEMLLVDEREIELFDEAGLADRTKFWAAPDTFETLSNHAKDRVHGLKLFTDGALGARTAALHRPYIGRDHDNRGLLIYSDEALLATISKCQATKKSLAIHAIGDRAIEQVITAIERTGESGRSGTTIRIEHAQMISIGLAKRAKSLGVCLSMQPNFSCDSVDYAERMDAGYCEMNNPFRMLIDDAGFVAGDDLIFGSDGMPHGAPNALQQSLFPAVANQRLSLDEFVAGYCLKSESPGTIKARIDEQRRTVTIGLQA